MSSKRPRLFRWSFGFWQNLQVDTPPCGVWSLSRWQNGPAPMSFFVSSILAGHSPSLPNLYIAHFNHVVNTPPLFFKWRISTVGAAGGAHGNFTWRVPAGRACKQARWHQQRIRLTVSHHIIRNICIYNQDKDIFVKYIHFSIKVQTSDMHLVEPHGVLIGCHHQSRVVSGSWYPGMRFN